MCGISGIYCLNKNHKADLGLLKQMTDLISHRGPDDEGYLASGIEGHSVRLYSGPESSPEVKAQYPMLDSRFDARLAFGFRRLAILDLSPAGHQPMADTVRERFIVFNGEIYNYLELKAELEALGYAFQSHSDTEVILQAYAAWGEDCVKRFNGIWAFAIWDLPAQKLFCSRDRFGVKPFYYCVHGDTLYFGSELKQLLATGVGKELNLPMIWRGMKINSLQVYGNETYWKELKALEPGHNLSISGGKVSLRRYHSLDPAGFEQSPLSFPEAVERYRELFLRAVRWQTRSDVEVGACLSGGLDSSAIVCAAAKLTDKPLQTFSSFFADLPQLDERVWIKEVANQCGCVSHLTSPVAGQALDWFPEATWFNDLPLGAGFAAQYGVMKLAQSAGVKVLLDGQGSDELTAGYRLAQYRRQGDLLKQAKFRLAWREAAAFISRQGVGIGASGVLKSVLSSLLDESRLYGLEFGFLRFEPFNQDFTARAKASLREPLLAQIANLKGSRLANYLFNAVYTTSLPTLLHWEDRMSMATSRESRVPFLDHELVEFAFTLPAEFKIKDAQGKLVHREAIQPLVPERIYSRKDKAIFGSPFHRIWMREGMKDAIETMIHSAQFRQRGIWNLSRVNRQWRRYLNGDGSQAEMLFNIFALETWFRRFG